MNLANDRQSEIKQSESGQPESGQPNIQLLMDCFHQLFAKSENTRLQMGANEPFYKAAKADQPAIIYFREDFFASALHEIAHWTIAGKERRQKDDFGYWYEADGRNLEQQKQFEKVEVKPQAIEWLFSLACNQPFHFSADNLSLANEASECFKKAVRDQAFQYLQQGLPPRAQVLFNHLLKAFRKGLSVELPNA